MRRKYLISTVARTQAEVENRFAGITLVGRRVVFIVDMSGSMELVDENTMAPEKWQGVRETLVKIMRSLPDLEKFQVIIFSEKVAYLLGQDGRWIDFDPKTSADRVNQSLAVIKPRGGTNMYMAFEAAFKFRADGLDAIYLFSDGLPNMGEGLSPEAMAKHEGDRERGDPGEVHSQNTQDRLEPRVAGQATGAHQLGRLLLRKPGPGAFLWALSRENDGSFVGMSKP